MIRFEFILLSIFITAAGAQAQLEKEIGTPTNMPQTSPTPAPQTAATPAPTSAPVANPPVNPTATPGAGQAIQPMPSPTPPSVDAAAVAPTPTPAPQPELQQQTLSHHHREWYFGGVVGVYAGGNLDLTSDDAGGTRVLQHADGSLKLALEAAYMGENCWGYNFGIEGDSQTKIENQYASVAMEQGADGDTELKIGEIYANAIYRWDNWYLPFGLNFASVKSTNPSPELTDIKAYPGLQVAGGYFFTNHFAIEFGMRWLGMQSTFNSIAGTSTTSKGFLSQTNLAVKGYF